MILHPFLRGDQVSLPVHTRCPLAIIKKANAGERRAKSYTPAFVIAQFEFLECAIGLQCRALDFRRGMANAGAAQRVLCTVTFRHMLTCMIPCRSFINKRNSCWRMHCTAPVRSGPARLQEHRHHAPVCACACHVIMTVHMALTCQRELSPTQATSSPSSHHDLMMRSPREQTSSRVSAVVAD